MGKWGFESVSVLLPQPRWLHDRLFFASLNDTAISYYMIFNMLLKCYERFVDAFKIFVYVNPIIS